MNATRLLSRLAPVLCTPLVAAPLVAQPGALAPLPEEAACRQRAVVWEQALVVTVKDKDGVFGWGKARLERVEIDQATHWLMQQTMETPHPTNGQLERREERSLWNAELLLVRLRTTKDTTSYQEVRWEKDKLLLRDSKAPKATPKTIETDGRPSADDLVVIHARKLEDKEVVEGYSLDSQAMKVHDMTLRCLGAMELTRDGQKIPVKGFLAKGSNELTIYMGADGRVEQVDHKDQPVVFVPAAASERDIRRAILANPVLLAGTLTRLRNSWKETGGEWRSDALGMALKLPPKGWKRQATTDGAGVFMALHETGDSAILIATEPVGDAWTLDEFGEALAAAKAATKGISGKPTRSEAKVMGRGALQLEYQGSPAGTPLAFATLLTLHRGYAVQATTITATGKVESFKSALGAILKSLKLAN